MNAETTQSPDSLGSRTGSVVRWWTAEVKLKAIGYRFYQGAKWEPKVGDLYCLTRDGLTLCQIAEWKDGRIWHRTIFDDDGRGASDWPLTEWTEEEFLTGGFMTNRCFVPLWAFPQND